MEALREPVRKRFEDEMLNHLKLNFADEVGDLSETNIRALIRLGVSKAEVYGIVNSDVVCRFIEHMVMHGANFDEDSRYQTSLKNMISDS